MEFAAEYLFFDDVEVGQEWESSGRTITQADVVNFAGLSGDFNPIHMDHEFAKTTHFQRPIAHGTLIVAIGSGLGQNSPPMRTLAFLSFHEWTFRGPVFFGDTIRIRTRVLEKEARPHGRRGTIRWHRQIINQDGKIVQDGITVTLVEGRGAKKKSETGD
jgi:acyl dehydratase